MDLLNLNSFLDFGYFLKYDKAKPPIDVTLATPEKYKDVPYKELVRIGTKLYRDAVNRLFEPGKDNCVPLSGGVDSRMVLAGLMECTEAKNVHTYTFGVPGALDYEIGQIIAKKIGTKHTQINLNDCVYTQDELLEISRRMDMQTVVFLTPPLSELNKFNKMDIWSGYFMDFILDVTYPEKDFKSFNKMGNNYLAWQQNVKSIKLSYINRSDYLKLLDGWDMKSSLSPGEMVRMCNGQIKNTLPNVCMKGFTYRVLAIDEQLSVFAVSILEEHKLRKKLYMDMLNSINPRIMRFPLKNNLGLSVNASKFAIAAKRAVRYAKKRIGFPLIEGTNYQDFNKNIIEKPYLKKIVRDNIYDLENRNILTWIKPSKILEDHLSGKGRYGDALIVLTSLEIHLKNGKVP